MSDAPSLLEFVHRYVGYPTAFLVAPAALLAFRRPGVHRHFGAVYLGLMSFLYLTGTYLTFTRHDWTSWPFFRNLSFNFFGFSMVVYAWRAISLFRRAGPTPPGRLDRFLAGVLTGSAALLTAVALVKDLPMKVFAGIAIALTIAEFRDLRAGFAPKPVLFRRHLRFVFLSYFYVLTVVSLVHLNDELPRTVKWLWPSAVGAVVLWMVHTAGPGRSPGALLRRAVAVTLLVGLTLGGYAIGELVRGTAGRGQAEPGAPEMTSGRGAPVPAEPPLPRQTGLAEAPP